MFSSYRKMKQSRAAITALLSFAILGTGCGKPERLDPLASTLVGGPPALMKIKINNYNAAPGKAFQHLFVSNFSVKVRKGELKKSFARDGLYDDLKVALNPNYGFLLTNPETVVNGYSDLLLYYLGIKSPQQILVYCSPAQMNSIARDQFLYNDTRRAGSPATYIGLRDCQKNYMGLDPNKFNYTGDGIPDYLKLTCGLNPGNRFDAFVSSSGDGVANIDKCKMHLPIDEDSRSMANQIFAYKYDIRTLTDGSAEFKVTNIPIFDDEENFIAIYLTETDLSDQTLTLYTAFARIPPGFNGRELEFDYWYQGTPATQMNREIIVPPPPAP